MKTSKKTEAPVTPRIKHSYRYAFEKDLKGGLPKPSEVLPSLTHTIGLPTTGTVIDISANGTPTGFKLSILRSTKLGCCHVTMIRCTHDSDFYVVHASAEPVEDKHVMSYIIEILNRISAGAIKTLFWEISYLSYMEDLSRQNPNLEAYRLASRVGMRTDLGLRPMSFS